MRSIADTVEGFRNALNVKKLEELNAADFGPLQDWGSDAEFKEVGLDQLYLPDEFQRDPTEKRRHNRILEVASNFDWNQLDPPRVIPVPRDHSAYRHDKEMFFVFAGGGRSTALGLRGYEGTVPVIVMTDTTAKEAALAIRNEDKGRTNQNALDRLKSGNFGGDPDSLEIVRVLDKYGLKAGTNARDVQAADSLYTIVKNHREKGEKLGWPSLDTVIGQLLSIWPKDTPGIWQAPMLNGMALFLREYGDRFDDEARATLRNSTTPGALLAELRTGRVKIGGVAKAETSGEGRKTRMAAIIRRTSGIYRKRKFAW